jgi:hypothetical protein
MRPLRCETVDVDVFADTYPSSFVDTVYRAHDTIWQKVVPA